MMCRRIVFGVGLLLSLSSCAHDDYKLTQAPNYDELVGQEFSSSIYKGRQVYKVIHETETQEELAYRRSDGCMIVFTVHKENDVILSWRVEPGKNGCLMRRKALSR